MESARWLRVSRAARVLDGISKKSQNAVPDAVLNSTKCIVVYPSIRGRPANVSVGGVASRREEPNHWSTPTFIDFKGHGIRGRGTDLLIVILDGTGVRDLRSGGLKITAPKGAAPLVNTTPVGVEKVTELVLARATTTRL
jgi:lipid-binding SYLF domain-containing protein